VHGDLERTTPNIGSLIKNEADIFQLDVLKIYEKLEEDVISDFMSV
jgi:tRNA pseudouridine synthase 10